MSARGHVLIVEDDEAIATGLCLNLKLEGFQPSVAGDGQQALEVIHRDRPDLILLDIGLPGKDGITVIEELRAAQDRTPVIVVSARGGEYDKVAALKLGADDYVTKPFALAELVARIDAVLRRVGGEPAPPTDRVDFGSITIDLKTHQVARDGKPVKMTRLEFALLTFFVNNPGQVFSRRNILKRVWQTSGTPRTVDNFVAQLRAKLEEDPEQPKHFITVRGSGYRFDL